MMSTLLSLIPALPLLAAVLTAVLGPRVLRERSHWPTILALAGALVCSIALLVKVQNAGEGGNDGVGYEFVVDLWQWANVADAGAATSGDPADFNIWITLRADALTAIMLVTVTFVALLVAIYSAGYMHGERGYWRFFSYVSLFVFSMTMLVSVSNFVLLYVFWEAVGVCSYLLIGFWYQKPEAAAAGKKAFLVNRVGDFGFALGLFLIWTTYGTLSFHDTVESGRAYVPATASVNEAENAGAEATVTPGVLGQNRLAQGNFVSGETGTRDGNIALAICLLLLLGACGKSAQFPLHVWLPDAMEGPTPVSALIHAATMVTAGVYMIARCTPLFAASPDAQLVVAIVGAFTALLAGIIALTQTDLKRILAYSTISQLGYMFLALGTGSTFGIVAGMFHLFTHAFFKALLFLGAGSVMHAMGGVIDVRRFGGLRRIMPITCITFLAGSLALAGIVPFAGFFSKDAIIGAVHDASEHRHVYEILFYSALVTAFLTAVYTFRAFFLAFFGDERVPPEAGDHAHESPGVMTVPLAILAAGALFAGFLNVSLGGEAWNRPFAHLLEETPSLAYIARDHVAHADHGWIAALSSVIAFAGVGLAAFLYLGDRQEAGWLARGLAPLYRLSHGKFFFDQIYAVLFVWPLRGLAWLAYAFDLWVIDGLVNLCGRVPPAAGRLLRNVQTGLVPYYAMLMVLGLLVLLGSLFVMQ